MSIPPLVVLAGPTGTGKTALSLDLAEALAPRPVEIVNADALQLYRGLDVGTAKPSIDERRGVPHHLFDLWDVTEAASVARYRDAARSAILDIAARGAVPVLVGGSGLYLESVLERLDFPGTDPAVRSALEAEAERIGAAAMHARLADVDAAAAERIPVGNVRRVVRALEVVTLTGRPYAASLPTAGEPWRASIRFVVDVADDPLRERLLRRAARMWEGGLLEEVRSLVPLGLRSGTTASRAIGYAQALAVLDGTMTEGEGLAETVRLTWRMVRRQRAWFARRAAVAVDGLADPLATVLPMVLPAVLGGLHE